MATRYSCSFNQAVTAPLTGANEEILSVFDIAPATSPRVTFGGPAAPSSILGIEVQVYLQDTGSGGLFVGAELVSMRVSPHVNGTRLAAPTFQTLFNVTSVTTVQGVISESNNRFASPLPAGQGLYIEEWVVRIPAFTPPAGIRIIGTITFVCE